MNKIIKKIDVRLNIQLALGITIAVLLAYFLNLKYYITAGVITILTVKNTRAETLKTSLNRLIGFGLMIVFADAIYIALGYKIVSFGIFVLAFGLVSSFLDITDGLSSNVVLASHFYDSASIGPDILVNETLLFIIGVGIGIIVNLIMPTSKKNFAKAQKHIDADFKEILISIRDWLAGEYCKSYESNSMAAFSEAMKVKLANLDMQLSIYQNSLIEASNNFHYDDDQIRDYYYLRLAQLHAIQRVSIYFSQIKTSFAQSEKLAAFMDEIIGHLADIDHVDTIMHKGEEIIDHFKNDELPKTREEFEKRAILFIVLESLIMIMEAKEEYVIKVLNS